MTEIISMLPVLNDFIPLPSMRYDMGEYDLELKILLLCCLAEGAYGAAIYRTLAPGIVIEANPGTLSPGLNKISRVLHDLESRRLCESKLLPVRGKGNAKRVYTATNEGWKQAEARLGTLTQLFQEAATIRRKQNDG
jgi:DNA-binding PadR family transcriptional regulator